jgi:two-component system response regulator
MNDLPVSKLLLVEDSPQDLDLALRALSDPRLVDRIHVVRDGAEALDFVFCEGAYATRLITDAPRVIILDLNLPKIDGLEVLKRLRRDPRTKQIPVVVLTSSKEQGDMVESCNLGVSSYVVKPVRFEEFVATIRELGLYWLVFNQPPKVAV